MKNLKIYLAVLCNKKILIKSIKISLVVGTLLNVINQGEVIFTLNFTDIDLLKSLLTYLVPFAVSTYTAASMKT